MPARLFSFPPRTIQLAVLGGLLPLLAGAHGVFDHSSRVWFFADHLEAVVTLGPEVARPFLNDGPEEVLRSGRMEIAYPFPLKNAPRLFEIKSGGTVLDPVKATVRSDGLEYSFTIFYPRPPDGPLKVHAVYVAGAEHLTKGTLTASDENGTTFAAKILSASEDELDVTNPPTSPVGESADLAVRKQTETGTPLTPLATVTEVSPPRASAPVPMPSSRENLKARFGPHLFAGALFAVLVMTACWLFKRTCSADKK